MLVKKNNWMFVDPIFRHINMATGPYSISIFANENNAGLSTEGAVARNVRCIHRFNAAKVESGKERFGMEPSSGISVVDLQEFRERTQKRKQFLNFEESINA